MADQSCAKEAEMEKEVGRVTHYFSHLGVAAAELTETISIGDTIHVKGHTTPPPRLWKKCK